MKRNIPLLVTYLMLSVGSHDYISYFVYSRRDTFFWGISLVCQLTDTLKHFGYLVNKNEPPTCSWSCVCRPVCRGPRSPPCPPGGCTRRCSWRSPRAAPRCWDTSHTWPHTCWGWAHTSSSWHGVDLELGIWFGTLRVDSFKAVTFVI